MHPHASFRLWIFCNRTWKYSGFLFLCFTTSLWVQGNSFFHWAHSSTLVLWNVFLLRLLQPNKACKLKRYKSKTTQSGNPTSLLTFYAPCTLPTVTSCNEYLTYRVCVHLCVCICESVQRWGNISTLIVATGTVWIIQQGAPLNVALCFLGLLAFPPGLLTSQLDSDTAGTLVSEPLRAQPAGVRVQADRPALRGPIARETVFLFFASCCPSKLAWWRTRLSWGTIANAASAAMKVWCTMCFIFCSLLSEKRQSNSGGWVFSWH